MDVTLDVRDMIISATCIEVWVPIAQWAELAVGEYCVNPEAAVSVDANCSMKMSFDGGNVSIIESDHSPESELTRQCDEERLFVDVHDVDDQCKAGVCCGNVQ